MSHKVAPPSRELIDSFNALEQSCRREGLATQPSKNKKSNQQPKRAKKPKQSSVALRKTKRSTSPLSPIHDGRADHRLLAYTDYLRTQHWSIVRAKAVKRAGHKCENCGSGFRLNVHHLTYEHLWYEYPDDLRVLCETCHAITHGAFIYAE
jgi:hypothetical protein